ncbi:hypothetical protein LWI28_015399 [Acer negundo]|uniref:Multidrug resistance protein ABC transporter family protein n=1 Tax=Acer negundo TaxID=4023 RepID=A0AAD5IZA5_ACENE|nr:hypothetical protein LWI28_015399 [Acer negundo]KAK4848622.1 hypothetical protein QYF36_015236 [Acer negundo]
MGNYVSLYRPSDATGKVILSDGSVHEFDKPITVAELMLEHPQEVVVEFIKSTVSEKRPSPLPADKKLEIKKVYLMLPMKRGKPASLSSEEARHVLSSANSVLRSRSLLSSSKFLPLFAKICPALTEDQGQRFVPLKKEETEEIRAVELKFESEMELLSESLDGRPEYLSRQLSGKGTWKPSLDTIKEKKIEKKVNHWLFQRSFIVSN